MKRNAAKHNRSQLITGLVVGAVFACVGLLFVFPNAGWLGLLWVLVSVGLMVICCVRLFIKK